MMRKAAFLLTLALPLCLPAAAMAAPKKDEAPKPVKAVTPSQDAAPLPAIDKPPTIGQDAFPALPPSRPCVEQDLQGLLRLVAVHEDPPGEQTAAFRASPNQYIQFRPNNMYAKLNAETSNISPKELAQQLREHSTSLLQYLVQDNGFVYFYQNSVAVDVQACFVVANNKLPFKEGQILMMPPKGQIEGRLTKVYEVLHAAGSRKAAAGAAKGKGGRKGKPRKKKQ